MPLCGRHLSEETKKKISEANSGENNGMYGKHGFNHPSYGKPCSEITKKKISEANKGKKHPHSKETRQKMRESKIGERNPNYGKHLSEETRRRMSESQKGEKGHNYGKHLSLETKKKLSESKKGKIISEETKRKIGEAKKGKHHSEETKRKIGDGNRGKQFSDATKKKIGEAHKGEKNHNYGKHLSERTRRKISEKARENRKKYKFPKHHTKPELRFEDICQRHDVDFHYVGDGSLWIGKKGKKQLNPDFIEANGKKICVEIFGDYWHSPLLNKNLRDGNTMDYRRRFYKKYGWHPIFIWESDIMRPEGEEFVLSVLRKEEVIR